MNSDLKPKIKISEQRRTIGVTGGSVSGLYLFRGSDVIAFESTLERDFLVRLETFKHVTNVTSQPFTLEYTCSQNKARKYTPDFLVEFDLKIHPYIPPQVIEVKPRKFIKKKLLAEKDKFKAAFQYCRENAFIFHFMDEERIHDNRFYNAKFLKRYRQSEIDSKEIESIVDLFKEKPSMLFENILNTNYLGKRYRSEGIYIVWSLIAQRVLDCDFNEKINFQTELWLTTDE